MKSSDGTHLMMQSRSLASVPQHSPTSHCSSGTLLGTSVAHRRQRSVRQVIRCYEFKGLAISRADAKKYCISLHHWGLPRPTDAE